MAWIEDFSQESSFRKTTAYTYGTGTLAVLGAFDSGGSRYGASYNPVSDEFYIVNLYTGEIGITISDVDKPASPICRVGNSVYVCYIDTSDVGTVDKISLSDFSSSNLVSQAGVGALAINYDPVAGNIYVLMQGPDHLSVRQIDVTDDSETSLTTDTGDHEGFVAGIGFDATHVFYSDYPGASEKLMKVAIGGGTPSEVAGASQYSYTPGPGGMYISNQSIATPTIKVGAKTWTFTGYDTINETQLLNLSEPYYVLSHVQINPVRYIRMFRLNADESITLIKDLGVIASSIIYVGSIYHPAPCGTEKPSVVVHPLTIASQFVWEFPYKDIT